MGFIKRQALIIPAKSGRKLLPLEFAVVLLSVNNIKVTGMDFSSAFAAHFYITMLHAAVLQFLRRFHLTIVIGFCKKLVNIVANRDHKNYAGGPVIVPLQIKSTHYNTGSA
jgi:hypothetical protein